VTRGEMIERDDIVDMKRERRLVPVDMDVYALASLVCVGYFDFTSIVPQLRARILFIPSNLAVFCC
jgi:hypothetical protein